MIVGLHRVHDICDLCGIPQLNRSEAFAGTQSATTTAEFDRYAADYYRQKASLVKPCVAINPADSDEQPGIICLDCLRAVMEG